MTEIIIISVVLISAAFVCAFLPKKYLLKTGEPVLKNETEIMGESDFSLSPMSLRNGCKTTRDKNPTLAEQCVNIMNYSGESQLEEDYEETE